MKTRIAVLMGVIALALAVALVIQSSRARKQQGKIESLQVEVEKLAQQTRASESEIKELQKERGNLRSDLLAAERTANEAAQAKRIAPVATDGTPRKKAEEQGPEGGAASRGGNLGSMLGNMLKNPEMRKAMEEQQKLGLNMMYGGLFKKLGLTPEQEEKFKEILLDQQMSNMSQAGAFFDSSTNRTEVAQRMAAQQKERDQQLKDLIGEEKFAQYQDYNQTVSERMMLEQFGKDVELTPDQKDQLLGILKEEKKTVQTTSGLDSPDANRNWEAAMASPETADKLIALQEQVNARVMERAPGFLSAEQVRKLEPVLKSQLELQKAGMKMARQMFGGEGAGEAVPSPPK